MKNFILPKTSVFSFLLLGTFLLTAKNSQAQTWVGVTDTDYNEASNWNNGVVPAAGSGVTFDGQGNGTTDLSGGATNLANALNVRAGHVLNIDNEGGSLAVLNNVNMGRGLAGDGSTINHSAGSFDIGGLDMGGNATGGTSFYTLSGTGSLSVTTVGARDFDIGGSVGAGDFDTVFSIVGDSASVTLNDSPAVLRSSANISFTLGATGIDSIDTSGSFTIEEGAGLSIDGSAYTGTGGVIPLFLHDFPADETEFSESITGFSNFTTDVVYGDESIDLVLSPPTGDPQVISLIADTEEVSSGDDVTLSWETANASILTLDPGDLDVSAATSATVNPTETTTYTLTASNGVESNNRTIEILVGPRINSFTTNQNVTNATNGATLSWDVDNAPTLTLDPGGIDVSGEVGFFVNPDSTTTYTLTATNGGASIGETLDIVVIPEIFQFGASASRVVSGGTVTLNWMADDFPSLTLDPGGIDVTGETSFVIENLTANTTYTLIGSDGTNTVSTEFTVVLLNAEPPEIPESPGMAVISVNFFANDADALADHIVESGETAGFLPTEGDFWTNIDLRAPGAHGLEAVFPQTALIDTTGNANAASISGSVESTFFVGHAASSAALAQELGLEGNDDDLFNSYLALNGPSGDGTPADAAILNVSGLGAAYTRGGYSVIIYSDSDRRNAGNATRQSLFTLTPNGGSPVSAFVEDDDGEPGVNIFDGQYVFSDGIDDGQDYSNFVIFEGLTADSFSLEITSPDGGRGAISGMQIIGFSGDPLTLLISESGGSLDFSWNSREGMQYDLRSDVDLEASPATWAIHTDGATVFEGVPATATGTNILSGIPFDGERRFFVITEEQIPPLFFADFEDGEDGFTVSTVVGSDWEFGTPDTELFNGTRLNQGAGGSDNCWGTVLGDATNGVDLGYYVPPTETILSSPAIDLTNALVSASLSFSEALDVVEDSEADSAEVFVVDASTGVMIGEGAIYQAEDTNDAGIPWELVSDIPLPTGSLGRMIRIEFRLRGAGNDFAGWYIDNVTIGGQ
ncbi:hypothetical protein OAF27_00375 [Verrucomicrobiales bacterium]|nr:hypothetical protein [Verrucomicrobiales bacterium]